MRIPEVMVWGVGVIIALNWVWGVRTYVRRGIGVTKQSVNQGMLFVVSLASVAVLPISSFHLFWMFPVGFVLGALSLAFPFSLLSIPGRVFGRLCTIGLDPDEVAENTAKVRRLHQSVASGTPPVEGQEQMQQSFAESRPSKMDLIRNLAKMHVKMDVPGDPMALAARLDAALIDSLSEMQLIGSPPGTIVTIVETYSFFRRQGLPDQVIFSRIEDHRSVLGSGKLPDPLNLETYTNYRLDLEYGLGPLISNGLGRSISREFVTEAVRIARKHFGC
jgi:hypothetical protein